MNLGDQLKLKVGENEQFSFLCYLDDLNIGPSRSDIDLLMTFQISADVDKIMTLDELEQQIRQFTNLIYARHPRFYNNFRVSIKRMNMNFLRTRYYVVVRYN